MPGWEFEEDKEDKEEQQESDKTDKEKKEDTLEQSLAQKGFYSASVPLTETTFDLCHAAEFLYDCQVWRSFTMIVR